MAFGNACVRLVVPNLRSQPVQTFQFVFSPLLSVIPSTSPSAAITRRRFRGAPPGDSRSSDGRRTTCGVRARDCKFTRFVFGFKSISKIYRPPSRDPVAAGSLVKRVTAGSRRTGKSQMVWTRAGGNHMRSRKIHDHRIVNVFLYIGFHFRPF